MPLTDKGNKIMKNMKDQYGAKKAKKIFYASENKGTIKGVHNKKADYISLLTPAERVGAMQLGATLKCAEHRIPAAKVDEVLKTAGISAEGVAKAIAVTSVLAGVPMGVAAHVINKRITNQKQKELELKEKIKYYRNATQGLEAGLEPANQGAASGLSPAEDII